MLYPAQLYKEELNRRLISCWYIPKYRFYFGEGRREFQVPDNTDYRQDFVHLDDDGHVDGYFSYNYNDCSKQLTNFGLISFVKDGRPLVKDAINRVKYMFEMGAQRCEFWAFADNPVCELYDWYAGRYGGHRVGYFKRCSYFDGEYHDSIIWEFLREDLPTEWGLL